MADQAFGIREIERLRRDLLGIVGKYKGKLDRAIESLDPADASFADVTRGLDLVSKLIGGLQVAVDAHNRKPLPEVPPQSDPADIDALRIVG